MLQAIWEAAGGLRDPRGPPGPGEDMSLVNASFFVHVAERVVCEPCGNKVTHIKDFYEQVICASATSIRRCQQVRPAPVYSLPAPLEPAQARLMLSYSEKRVSGCIFGLLDSGAWNRTDSAEAIGCPGTD